MLVLKILVPFKERLPKNVLLLLLIPRQHQKICFKWELHRAIQELKKITGKADTETEGKKKNNKNRTKYDEMEFKEKGGKYYMFHKGQELAMYVHRKQTISGGQERI